MLTEQYFHCTFSILYILCLCPVDCWYIGPSVQNIILSNWGKMGQIEETLQSLLSYLCACTQTCMHANINAPYVLECLEAYSGSSVFDQRCKVHNE